MATSAAEMTTPSTTDLSSSNSEATSTVSPTSSVPESSAPLSADTASSASFTGSQSSLSTTTVGPSSLTSSVFSSLSSGLSHATSGSLQTSVSSTTTSSSTRSQATATASPSSSPKHGLNTGAWVGIAVGCAAAGLIIGILAAFAFLRRRSEVSAEQEPLSPGHDLEQKSFDSRLRSPSPQPALAVPALSSAAKPAQPITPDIEPLVSDLGHFLPIPKPERDLSSELRSLGHLIEDHVENYYHRSEVAQSAGALSEALSSLWLSHDAEGVPGHRRLANLALEPETRQVALQHIITRAIFSSLSIESVQSQPTQGKRERSSLLPPSIVSMLKNVAPCEKHSGNAAAVSLALTRWRQLSAFLLNPARSERGCLIPNEDTLEPQANVLVATLDTALGVFVNREDAEHQKGHLQEVALECAKLGYTIFSQPAEHVYSFSSPLGDAETEVVVCPGLYRVSDDLGARCTPEAVAEPQVRSL